MKNFVLVITHANDDDHTKTVLEHLDGLDQRYCRFDTEKFPIETSLTLSLSSKLLRVVDGEEIDLTLAKSVWYRRPVSPLILRQDLGDGYKKFIGHESRAALWSLYTTLDSFWVNPPVMGSKILQSNKLLQLKDALAVGIRVPETLITNNPNRLLAFCREKGGVIACKLLHGDWFVQGENPATLFVMTQKITTSQIIESIDDIALAPVLAQEYVEKKFELRVTIVGEKIFTCAIYSQESELSKTDWRNYDFENVKHEPYQLPHATEEKLLSLMRVWGLQYGAIDMIVTPSGDFVFLEINPGGQWLWIEQLTEMSISKALAELLTHPPHK